VLKMGSYIKSGQGVNNYSVLQIFKC
jgi:hypothetical protein